MTQELKDKRIEKIRSTLNAEEKKEFDLGLLVTEKRKGLYTRLSKT